MFSTDFFYLAPLFESAGRYYNFVQEKMPRLINNVVILDYSQDGTQFSL